MGIPGVRAAAIAHILPLELGSDLPFTIEGKYVPGTQTGVGNAEFRPIGPGYFKTLAIPLRRGRVFDARDRHGTLPVAVINEAAAREIWANQDPIGQRIHVGRPYVPDLADATAREIIGVVGNVREDTLAANPPAILYVPMSQLGDGLRQGRRPGCCPSRWWSAERRWPALPARSRRPSMRSIRSSRSRRCG